MAKALSEVRWQNSLRETYERKITMRAGSGRVPSGNLHPTPKPRTLSFWHTGEKGCSYVREHELQD